MLRRVQVGQFCLEVDFGAMLRRLSWAAQQGGLSKIPRILLVCTTKSPREGCDPVQDIGSCVREGKAFRVSMHISPAWLTTVEETFLHEIAHVIAWRSENEDSGKHTAAWAAVYGVLYHHYFDRDKQGPGRPPMRVVTKSGARTPSRAAKASASK